jgi:predicted aspartyl protease
MSTVTGDQFGFASVARIKIEIIEGVSYKDMFFLIDNSPKTLLGMPFISKMKMAIDHKDNSLWDSTFTNLKDSKNACTVIIVLLLKNVSRRRV